MEEEADREVEQQTQRGMEAEAKQGMEEEEPKPGEEVAGKQDLEEEADAETGDLGKLNIDEKERPPPIAGGADLSEARTREEEQP